MLALSCFLLGRHQLYASMHSLLAHQFPLRLSSAIQAVCTRELFLLVDTVNVLAIAAMAREHGQYQTVLVAAALLAPQSIQPCAAPTPVVFSLPLTLLIQPLSFLHLSLHLPP